MNEKETQISKAFKNSLYLLLSVVVSVMLSCAKKDDPQPEPEQVVQQQPPTPTKDIRFTMALNGTNEGWIRLDWQGDGTTDSTITLKQTASFQAHDITKNLAVPGTLKVQWYIVTNNDYTYAVQYSTGENIEVKTLKAYDKNYSIEVKYQ